VTAPIDIARIAHEANRAYCQTLGDYTLDEWGRTPQDKKERALVGVVYALQHPGAGPEDLHEVWMTVMAADGWKYGPSKHDFLKTHPCMRPWAELPDAQKVKDRLFLGIVRALGARP
jgi:hypothetical protein